jgi:hypothetical protein
MLNRRDAMLRLGQLGLGALTLPGLLGNESAHAEFKGRRGKARSCIYTFLWGGPPQQDLWDMKPDAPQGIRSLFQPIKTVVPGIHICDQMPRLAKQMGKVAVVRSLTHDSDVHEPSVYHVLTGKQNSTLISPRNQRRRSDFPNLPSIVSYFTPPGDLPTTVTVPRPIGHDGVTYAGTYAGFLGPRHDAMELREAPNSSDPPTHPIRLDNALDSSRLIARRGLLDLIEEQDRLLQGSKSTEGIGGCFEQAFRMLSSPSAKRAFDLDLEPPAVRDRYGRNEYGESFLLARRLIESGVRLVSVIWLYIMPNGRVANVWDNHGGTGGLGGITGYAMLKEKYCIPPLDQGYSALIEDLSDRGMLDDTLVVAVGEFGRTPRINGTQGRDHWGRAQSLLLAGGGVRGGQVYGATDAQAAFVKDNPVSPEDLLATIYDSLGIAPESEIRDRDNRPYRIVEGRPVRALFA